MIRLAAATAIYVAVSTSANADPDRISVLIGSHHVDAKMQFESRNPGFFLTWEDRGGLDYSLGAYRNSYGATSIAATVALPILKGRNADLSLFAGVALYPGNGPSFAAHWGDLVPLAGVQIRSGHLFIQVIPSDGRTADAIVAFGLTSLIQR